MGWKPFGKVIFGCVAFAPIVMMVKFPEDLKFQLVIGGHKEPSPS